MKISETFIEDILKKNYPIEYASVYDDSMLIQYLDKKMKAVHGDNTSRRSLANIYAIYSILYYYKDEFYDKGER